MAFGSFSSVQQNPDQHLRANIHYLRANTPWPRLHCSEPTFHGPERANLESSEPASHLHNLRTTPRRLHFRTKSLVRNSPLSFNFRTKSLVRNSCSSGPKFWSGPLVLAFTSGPKFWSGTPSQILHCRYHTTEPKVWLGVPFSRAKYLARSQISLTGHLPYRTKSLVRSVLLVRSEFLMAAARLRSISKSTSFTSKYNQNTLCSSSLTIIPSPIHPQVIKQVKIMF